jgi:beta-galactosidase
VWGIANEVDFGPNRPGFLNNGTTTTPDPSALLQDLNKLAHELDPARPSALATCCEGRDMAQIPIVAGITDVSAANRYFGWYYGKASDVGPDLDRLHAKRPAQPMALSEYGAGGAFSIHTDNVAGGPVDAGGRAQPEEYQAAIHEETWPQLAQRRYLWATWLWNGFDFGSTVRREGDSIDINTKGLVSYDGAIRKDAFYYYRAQWSAQPTLHIAGRRYANRAYGVSDVKVYSNAAHTDLLLNGRSLGVKANCANHVCLWRDVRLTQGENRFEARGSFAGKMRSDAITWRLDTAQAQAYRIDAGALVAAGSEAGRFGSDNFFEGGRAATMDQTPRYRPPVLAKIAGTADRALVASYRTGNFSYHLPVPAGRYRVTLTFAEPSLAAGERVFNVLANGQIALADLDVAAVAGAPLTAISRQIVAQANAKGLTIAFVGKKGEAMVSALVVEPEG